MRYSPFTSIAIGLGAAGTAKLAGVQLTKDNFEKWGYPASARVVVGATEVGLAAAALAALRDPIARPVVGLGTVCTMVGALATHVKGKDSPLEMIPAAALLGCGLHALTGG